MPKSKTRKKKNNRPAVRADKYGVATVQDHLPAGGKLEKVKVELRGHTWKVNRAALDDVEIMEQLVALETGNPRAIFSVMNATLGAGQVQKVKKLLADPETGITKFSDYSEFFQDLLEKINPNS